MLKFIADRMLGKLAKGLRILGYDTVYYRGEEPYPLIQLARREARVVLTRNSKLLPRTPEDRIIRITKDHPFLQLKELIQKRYIGADGENPFSRCLLCNAILNEIPREEAEGKVPDFIYYQEKKFFQCPTCQRIYWQGSHIENMKKKVEELFEQS